MKKYDFPWFFVCLPEGIFRQSGIEIIPVLSKGDDSWQGLIPDKKCYPCDPMVSDGQHEGVTNENMSKHDIKTDKNCRTCQTKTLWKMFSETCDNC